MEMLPNASFDGSRPGVASTPPQAEEFRKQEMQAAQRRPLHRHRLRHRPQRRHQSKRLLHLADLRHVARPLDSQFEYVFGQ